MHDLPSALLLQQSKARSMSGEDLEVFGKSAAAKYCHGQVGNLTDAVVETVKTAGLSPEQVRRVVEFANTSAYIHEFRKEGSDHKVIEFVGGPADFPEVLRDLNDGGNETLLDKHAHDYSAPPPQTSELMDANAARLGLENTKLAEAFGVEEEALLPYAEPYQDVMDLRDKMAGLSDLLESEISTLETHMLMVDQELFGHVKAAALSGTTLGQIIDAWSTVGATPELVKAAFIQLSPQLLENEVFRSHADLADSLAKTASAGVANPEHPLVQSFIDFSVTITKLSKARAAQDEVSDSRGELDTMYRLQLQKEAGKESVIGHIPKVWAAATKATAKAGDAVRGAATPVLGEHGGKALGAAVKYAPHAAAGLAGEEAYQRARYNPVARGTMNFVKSRIPYTREHQIRQYSLQS